MPGKLQGEVVAAREETGDLLTNIASDQLDGVPRDESVTIKCDGHVTAGIHPADHQQPAMTLLAVLGNDEVLELQLVGDSAVKFLGIRPGATVTVSW